MTEYINGKLEKFKEYMCGKSCDVIGIGISNLPLVDFLLSLGCRVSARDKRTKEELAARGVDTASLENKGVTLVCRPDYLSGISSDVIFKTPGLRFDVPEILEAAERGAYVTSEMEVFLSLCPAKIFAITGSDGKTTTTTLTAKLLELEGKRVYLGGNIGTPLLSNIAEIRPDDAVVVELSSFQLHCMNRFTDPVFCEKTRFPDVAVITNVSPNHLDWHTGMDEYVDSKRAVFDFLRDGGKLVTNAECDYTRGFYNDASEKCVNSVLFSSKRKLENGYFCDDEYIYRAENGKIEKILARSDILLPGTHNAENYMAAISAVEGYVSKENVKKLAETFGGVKHRLQYIDTVSGVAYYNSSIDSSPSRTLAALGAFGEKLDGKMVLVMGGYDKHIPFDPIGEPICKKARAVFVSGPTKEKIKKAITDCKEYDKERTKVVLCENFDFAVISAHNAARDGDAVILTPACASFDEFKNFEVRGERFISLVKGFAENEK